jgi:cytochrome P450
MKRKYPDGPPVNLPLALIRQFLPGLPRFDQLEFGRSIARRYGDIVHYKFGPLRIYQVSHPDLARQILIDQPEKFHKPQLMKHAFRPFSGEGLVTSDGALWKLQRKLIQPSFHHGQLAAYGDDMTAHAIGMCESFAHGDVRDIGAEMTQLTLAIVVKTLFGSDLPGGAAEIRRSMLVLLEAAGERVGSPLRLPSWIPTRRSMREKRAVAKLDAMLYGLIQNRRASTPTRRDLLSALLASVDQDSGEGMSRQQLRDEMMTLFLAGHETTANALTWTWYLLSRHPEVEAKLLDELRRELGGRAPTAADLPRLPYTEMVVRESLRLYPPAPGVAREPADDFVIGGYEVPKGSLILINTNVMHHDARFFPDPERFDPERFARGWEERVPRYAYLPFGAGPRVCIGNGFAMMEARLILATVAQRVKFSLERNIDIKPIQVITLRPADPVRMKIGMREKCSAG